jgi:hypothetical protein
VTTVDLVKLGSGKIWHLLDEIRHDEETAERLARVTAVALCGREGEQGDTERGFDPRVIAHEGATVCGSCRAVLNDPAATAAETTTHEEEKKMTTTTETKVSSREAIRLAFANDLGPDAEAKTAAICEAAAKYATSLGFNPRHQLEATLHAQARKDDGVVVRAGRGLFRLRPEAEEVVVLDADAQDALAEEVEGYAPEVEAPAEEAKPEPKPKRTRKPAAKRTRKPRVKS